MTDDVDEGAAYDGDNDDFYEWCADNDVDPDSDDAWYEYKDAKAESDDPYGSRGLLRSDFL